MSYPRYASSWMQDNLSWLKAAKIRDIVHMPGSHDAGMDRTCYTTSVASDDNVITQNRSMYEQLQCGVRWFDVRPMLWGGKYYCGHATYASTFGWQGGLGMSIEQVISDVNRFTEEHKELIVLRITHINDFDGGKQLSLDQQTDLLRQFYDGVKHVRKASENEDALDQTLDKYVGTDQCVVIATRANAQEGNMIDDSVYERAGLKRVDFWMEIVSNCYMQDDVDAVLTSKPLMSLFPVQLLYALDFGGNIKPSILNKTMHLHKRTFGGQPSALMCWTGGRDYTTKGVVFQTDRICDEAPLNMCLAASRAQWQTLQRSADSSCIVTYGGKLIQDTQVLNRIAGNVATHGTFRIDNSLFNGDDPWEGSPKSCCIMQSSMRNERSGDGLFWDARFAREGEEIDFAFDISKIQWHDRYLNGFNYRQATSVFLTARLGDIPFRIDIDGMGFLQPDPERGTRKRIILRYKSISARMEKERNLWEGRTYFLARDIDWLRYQDWYVDDPVVYRQFFDRIDGESSADIHVGNELFDGRDPAEGTRKRLFMSLRKRPGTDREESQLEGKDWNVAGLL